MESQIKCIVRIAAVADYKYATGITEEMAYSAAERGTGIPPRTPEYILSKLEDGLAVIAINPENQEWVGFCCIEVWQHEKYIANSGLIISPKYRRMGISKDIKVKLFELCRTRFPHARIFSLTANPAVMHVNERLGFKVVSYADVMKDEWFLKGCNSWVNFIELMSNNRHADAHYVAMVFDPAGESKETALTPAAHYFLNQAKLAGKKKDAVGAIYATMYR